MHESKALCSEVKICVRFGVGFCKKVFTFAIIFSFLEGILEKFSPQRCRARCLTRYSGADFSLQFVVAWCNLGVLPVQ